LSEYGNVDNTDFNVSTREFFQTPIFVFDVGLSSAGRCQFPTTHQTNGRHRTSLQRL